MVNIIKEELPIEESLKRKLELICEFSKVAPTIINDNINPTTCSIKTPIFVLHILIILRII